MTFAEAARGLLLPYSFWDWRLLLPILIRPVCDHPVPLVLWSYRLPMLSGGILVKVPGFPG